jgi:hypothetical protein
VNQGRTQTRCSGDQILVERRGWLDRNQTFLISTILSATSIVVALLR